MADEIRRLIRVRTSKGATFKRDGFGKKAQLSDSWRKPRGQHNKQREQKKARGALPKPGFGSPIAVRGMHPSGFFDVLVYTPRDLEGLNPKTQAIRISTNLGRMKRSHIQEKALSAGFKVLNVREIPSVPKPEQEPVKPKEVKEKTETAEIKSKPKEIPEKKEETGVAKPGKPVKAKPKVKKKVKTEPSEERETEKETKPKVKKPKSGPTAEGKPKRSPQQKAASEKEPGTDQKTDMKLVKKPRKKGGSEVKDNE